MLQKIKILKKRLPKKDVSPENGGTLPVGALLGIGVVFGTRSEDSFGTFTDCTVGLPTGGVVCGEKFTLFESFGDLLDGVLGGFEDGFGDGLLE